MMIRSKSKKSSGSAASTPVRRGRSSGVTRSICQFSSSITVSISAIGCWPPSSQSTRGMAIAGMIRD